ncbi:MAG: hypothetical protein JWP69_556 [Flaviaesturariibacter sp.]|nr:hypothetical protein [Flaviaesturariibacter sp.]
MNQDSSHEQDSTNILQIISNAAMLTFQAGNLLIGIKGSPGTHFGLLTLISDSEIFVVSNYEYDGQLQAKAILASMTNPGFYWNTVANADGLVNAVVLGKQQETIILNAMPSNTMMLSFARAATPPAPAIKAIPDGTGGNYLAYGFDSPLLNEFSVNVVG